MSGQINVDVIQTSAGPSLGAGNATLMKNRIINGGMTISQRGTSFTNINGGLYTLDRWSTYGTVASKFTIQQNAGSITPPVGFTNYLGVTSLSAYSVTSSDVFVFQQSIEGYNVADLGWGTANAKTVTLSFWVYSSLTGTFGGSLENSGDTRAYAFSYSIPTANTWTYITIAIPGDTAGTWLTNNGIGITVLFNLGAGSTFTTSTPNTWITTTGAIVSPTGATSVVGTNGATFYITGVQLEVGSSATGFEYRQYQQELALCQRYCSIINDWYCRAYNVASSYIGMAMTLPVTMRTTPTVTIIGTPIYQNTSGMVAVTNYGNSSIDLYALVSSTGDSRFNTNGTSNYIIASAEL